MKQGRFLLLPLQKGYSKKAVGHIGERPSPGIDGTLVTSILILHAQPLEQQESNTYGYLLWAQEGQGWFGVQARVLITSKVMLVSRVTCVDRGQPSEKQA